MSSPATPPPDYYVNFVLRMLSWVQAHHGRLLRAAECHWCRQFVALDDGARRLYVRLLLRKGPLLRTDRLNYAEVDNLPAAQAQLAAAGLLTIVPWCEPAALLALLSRAELRALFAPLPATLRRADMLSQVQARFDADCIRTRIAERYPWCMPLGRLHFERLQLAFFCNQQHSLTEFITADLGIVRYPRYTISGHLFGTRHEVDAWLECSRLNGHAEAFGRAGQADGLAWCQARLPGWGAGPHTRGRAARLDARTGRWLERCAADAAALQVYARTNTPMALERQVRVLKRQARTLEASVLAASVCAQHTDAGLRETLRGLLQPHAARPAHGADEAMLLHNDGVRPVEQQVLAALQARGLEGLYTENTLMATIFGLVFWDITFADVPGVFVHPCQRAPLDLLQPEFYLRRRSRIEQRLTAIEQRGVMPFLAASWYGHYGSASQLVRWGLPFELLRQVVERLPRRALHNILARMAQDLRTARRGWPDLVVFSASDCRFIEVKGPGDQLRAEQRLWLRFLAAEGLQVGVVQVQWI